MPMPGNKSKKNGAAGGGEDTEMVFQGAFMEKRFQRLGSKAFPNNEQPVSVCFVTPTNISCAFGANNSSGGNNGNGHSSDEESGHAGLFDSGGDADESLKAYVIVGLKNGEILAWVLSGDGGSRYQPPEK